MMRSTLREPSGETVRSREPGAGSREPGAGSREPGAGSRDCVRGSGGSVRHPHRHRHVPDRAADAMGRAPSTGSGPALRARREPPSRPSPGPRRPAGPASSPSVPRFGSRLPRAAARLAQAALLLAGAGAVAAPASADVLVSNIGQSSSDGSLLANNDVAQRFTTGSNPAGYTLSSIELRIRTGSELAGWIVKLFSGSANGTKVADFGTTDVEQNTTKNYTFTVSGSVTLAKETDYWVVLEGISGEWFNTDADDEDGASESDWSIRNVYESRGASQTGSFSDGLTAALIRVNGMKNVPEVTQVEVTSRPHAGTPGALEYGVGQKIQITVTFDVAVVVTGDPEFEFRMGDSADMGDDIETKDAAYVRGSGTTELVFEYTVQSGDSDDNGIEILADALDLDSDDKIRDGADNDADLAHAQLGRQTGHKVDGSLTPDTHGAHGERGRCEISNSCLSPSTRTWT